MARPRAVDYDAKRNAIREAAAALFAEHGFDGCSMSDLAQRCVTTKSGLYHYYRSKEEVLHDILDEHIGKVLAIVRAAVAEAAGQDPRQRLELIVTRLLAAYASADDQHKVQLNELWRLPVAQRETIMGMEREIVRLVADTLAEINPNLARTKGLLKPVTMSLFGMINWHYLWFKSTGEVTRADYAELVSQLIVDGTRNLHAEPATSSRQVSAAE
jgi:TetR/AcrR family transcriptional regulator